MTSDRDLSRWLLDNERKAILPFKWILFAVTLLLWLWNSRWMLPPLGCFAVFNTYFLFLAGHAYLLLMRRVTIKEARWFCLASFLLDVAFVSVLIFCDSRRLQALGIKEMSDFYYFYFILVLRGYSLSTSQRFNLAINLLIVLIYFGSFAMSDMSYGSLLKGAFQIKLALLWMVILMSWFIVGLISQQKEELMAARERLLNTQHLADLGEMAAVVAHEVNTPIGIISANAEYLMKQTDKNDEAYEEFRIIRDESLRCKQIVSELLSYARPSAGLNPVALDLADLCRDVIGFAFRRSKERELNVEVEAAEGAPLGWADPNSVRQALLNVFINARQALGADGEIRVHVGPAKDDPKMVEVAVADNGPGIAPEDAERAFEPFFTRKRGGTGLGLAVTRRVIEGQNGRVSIGPRPDKPGTVVRLLLPVAKEGAEES